MTKINLASDLRHRATIKQLVQDDQRDALGQCPAEEKTVCQVWCSVVPQTGSLLSGRPAETQLSRTTAKLIIRYRAGITADMWAEVDGESYDILYVQDPYLQHKSLELFCEKRGP